MKAEKKAIVSFLRRHPLGTFATVEGTGVAELSSVYVHVDEDLMLYFITKTKTRKIKNILLNNNASFFVSDEESFTTVELTGKVAIIHDTLEFAKIYDSFHSLFESRPGPQWLPPIVQISAGKCVACIFTPTVIRHRVFDTTSQNENKLKEVIVRPRYRTKNQILISE